MIPTLFSFIFSLGVVILGARLFLSSSVLLSRLLRLPEMVIGATLVSLATTAPETLVSLFASLTAHSSLALGNVVGSGLVNLGLLLGILLLSGQGKLEQTGRGRRRSLILFFLVGFVYLWFLIFGKIGWQGGLILLSGALAFLAYTFGYAVKESEESLVFFESKIETHPKVIFKFLGGGLLLVLGSRFLVQSGASLAQIFGLPEILIGLTLVAIGTSIPELITVLTALFSGHARISLGNLTGATILTFTLALGVAAIVAEVKAPPSMFRFEFLILLFLSGLNVLFAFWGKLPAKIIGATCVFTYFFYLAFLFKP